jgi:hypothetical protein
MRRQPGRLLKVSEKSISVEKSSQASTVLAKAGRLDPCKLLASMDLYDLPPFGMPGA